MDDIAEAIFQWTEAHRKGIIIATTIIVIATLILNGMLENGLI